MREVGLFSLTPSSLLFTTIWESVDQEFSLGEQLNLKNALPFLSYEISIDVQHILCLQSCILLAWSYVPHKYIDCKQVETSINKHKKWIHLLCCDYGEKLHTSNEPNFHRMSLISISPLVIKLSRELWKAGSLLRWAVVRWEILL